MTLFINCCVREESRTDRLARAVLQKLGGDFMATDISNKSTVKGNGYWLSA